MRMKIDVEALLKRDAEVAEALDEAWLRRELGEVMHAEAAGEGRVELRASRSKDKIQVDGRIAARFAVACARCLEPARIVMDEPFFMIFEPARPEDSLPEEVELTESDVCWDTYEGPELDLAPFVREQILLSVPMRPLCREDCTGIPYDRPPEDPEQPPGTDPRWKALANLKPTR